MSKIVRHSVYSIHDYSSLVSEALLSSLESEVAVAGWSGSTGVIVTASSVGSGTAGRMTQSSRVSMVVTVVRFFSLISCLEIASKVGEV
jgi:hypothetical protein